MTISAQLVKELRERTAAGMMECKRALQEVGGDIEAAIEHMRKAGLAKADKKASRVAAEGLLVVASCEDGKQVTLLEANCETDFVAMGDEFSQFATKVAAIANTLQANDIDALSAATYDDNISIDDKRRELVSKIGENISLRRFTTMRSENGIIGHYIHGGKIGVLVEITGADVTVAKDLAMHIAASNPQVINHEQLDKKFIASEREIHRAKAEQSGKPANIIAKMVDGAMEKLFSEITLLKQKFVKDSDKSVAQWLQENKAQVIKFVRYELGEGIEKEQSDFVAEVMSQAKGQ